MKRSSISPQEPFGLSVQQRDGLWQLTHGGAVVLTERGHPVQHPSRQLLDRMSKELTAEGTVEVKDQRLVGVVRAGLFSAYSIQYDMLEAGWECAADGFRTRLLRDPILKDVAGPERVSQQVYYQPVYDCYERSTIETLRSTALLIEQSYGETSPDLEQAVRDAIPVCEAVRESLCLLPNTAHACVLLMCSWHWGQVLGAVALVSRQITARQYADAVIASQCLIGGVFADVSRAEESRVRTQITREANALVEYTQLTTAREGTSK